MGKLRGKDLQVMDKSTGNRFKAGPGDGIYASLLSAKTEALKQQRSLEKPMAQEQDFDREEERDNSMEYEHADELEHEQEHHMTIEQQIDTGLNEDEGNALDFSEEYEEIPELNLGEETGEKQKSGRKR